MRQQVPKCGRCEEERAAARAYVKSLGGKGKGKAHNLWDDADEDEEDEWGGGEPGIMKVRLGRV